MGRNTIPSHTGWSGNSLQWRSQQHNPDYITHPQSHIGKGYRWWKFTLQSMCSNEPWPASQHSPQSSAWHGSAKNNTNNRMVARLKGLELCAARTLPVWETVLQSLQLSFGSNSSPCRWLIINCWESIDRHFKWVLFYYADWSSSTGSRRNIGNVLCKTSISNTNMYLE